jgi:hypothetical protein
MIHEQIRHGQSLQPFRALNVVGPFFGLLLVLGLFSLDSEVRPIFSPAAISKSF